MSSAYYIKSDDFGIQELEQTIINLFRHLSPEWYPNNIIDSEIYDILDMFATQLTTASVEAKAAWQDLYILSARTGALPDETYSRLYDNFGVLFGINKSYLQDYELYNTGSVLQSYRQQLRLLFSTLGKQGSVDSLNTVGRAFFGIGSISDSEINGAVGGWRLTNYTGSVVSISQQNDFIIGNTRIPQIGFRVPISTGTTINAGDSFTVSYSVLGANTQLSEDALLNSKQIIHNFTNTGSVAAVSSSVRQLLLKTASAGLQISDTYTDNYTLGEFSANDESDLMEYVDGGYLRNIRRTSKLGEVVTGSVLATDSSKAVDWYWDWTMLTRNESYVEVGMRTYPSQSIPNTVYFKNLRPEGATLLPFASGSLGGHWITTSSKTLADVSGNRNNLVYYPGISTTDPKPIDARFKPGFGLFSGGENTYYYNTLQSSGSMPFGRDWFIEMWVYGLNAASAESLSHITFNIQEAAASLGTASGSGGGFSPGFDPGFDLGTIESDILPALLTEANNGVKFGIDGNNQNLLLWVRDGSVKTATGSLATYFEEDGIRPHYIACTYTSGSVYLYVDDNILPNCPISLSASLTPSMSRYASLQIAGSGVGVDEINFQEGVLSPVQAAANFRMGRPALASYMLASSSVERTYSQLEFRVFASGINEVELHKYALRGVAGGAQLVGVPSVLGEVARVPVFIQ